MRRGVWLGATAVTGGVLAILATGTQLVAAAAWLAPLLLLRFVRATPLVLGLPVAAALYAGAYAVAWRGTFGIPAAAFGLLGLLFFLPFVIDRLVTPRLRGLAGTIVFPAAWVSLEYALSALPLLGGQPLGTWASLAHSQAGNLPLLQLGSLTGMWGVTFVVAWFASLGAWAWREGVSSRAARRGVAGYALLIAAILVWGGWRIAAAPPVAESVRVAGIAVDNPALTVGVWNPVARGRGVSDADMATMRGQLDALHDTLLAVTVREARAGAEIIVWAEDNAIVFREDEAQLISRGREIARSEDVYLFMGMVSLVPGEKAENKVVAITPDGEVAFSYLKAFPTPWESSRRGDGIVRFVETPFGRVGAAICYDFDHPGLLLQAGRAAADIMLAPADDGMQAPWLHAEMATMRAIENGFSLVRPVIGGRALAVDPYGRVLAQAEYGQGAYFAGGTHVLVAQVPTRGVTTLYARIGDSFAWACLLALIAAVVLALLPVGLVASGRARVDADRESVVA
jgi:apolipoprotein N-acyltransferase